jgi:steroid delta-isomerase-like uncharacterized protein
MANVSELLDRFVALFNAGQFEEGERDYAPGGYGEEIGTNRRFTAQEVTANARGWKEAFPDAQGTIENKILQSNKGAAEIVWRGTHRGSLMGTPPTNRSVTVRSVVVIESDGSRITRSAHYIDVAGMMAQLGVSVGTQTASTR